MGYILILAKGDSPEGRDKEDVWWILWFDRDGKDSSVGYFQTEDSEDEVTRLFRIYLQEIIEENRDPDDVGAIPLYLPTEKFLLALVISEELDRLRKRIQQNPSNFAVHEEFLKKLYRILLKDSGEWHPHVVIHDLFLREFGESIEECGFYAEVGDGECNLCIKSGEILWVSNTHFRYSGHQYKIPSYWAIQPSRILGRERSLTVRLKDKGMFLGMYS